MKQALSNHDNFEYWLSNIDEEINFLLEIVPKEIKRPSSWNRKSGGDFVRC